MAVRRDRRRGGADVLDTRREGVGVGTPIAAPTIKNVDVWLRKNGTDIANSNSIQSLTDIDEREIMSFSYILELQAEDYIELMFAVNDLNVFFNSYPSDAVGPLTPSVMINITQVK